MRRTGAVAAVIAVVLLARCGEAERPFVPPVPATFPPQLAGLPAPVVVKAPEPAPAPAPPQKLKTQLDRVRELVRSLGGQFCGSCYDFAAKRCVPKLVELGESAYPDYITILADPWSSSGEIGGVRDILDRLGVKRRAFVPVVVQRLTAPDAMLAETEPLGDRRWDWRPPDEVDHKFVRLWMIYLLEDHGDESDAGALLPMLNYDDESVRRAAAEALARIGGPRELEALNAWLAIQNPTDRILPRIRKHRDALESRLRERQPPKPF